MSKNVQIYFITEFFICKAGGINLSVIHIFNSRVSREYYNYFLFTSNSSGITIKGEHVWIN